MSKRKEAHRKWMMETIEWAQSHNLNVVGHSSTLDILIIKPNDVKGKRKLRHDLLMRGFNESKIKRAMCDIFQNCVEKQEIIEFVYNEELTKLQQLGQMFYIPFRRAKRKVS